MPDDNMLEAIEAAQRILGLRFKNPDLLEEALTHASIAESRQASNERLEFLGDAVLGMIVCERIFRDYPHMLEGDMTKIKSAVVSRRTCAQIASTLGLDELLRLGKGMQTRSGVLPSSLSAAVLESIIGAVFLDAGIDKVYEFLLPHVEPIILRAAESGHQQNFKSVLQQHAQQRMDASPSYHVIDETGPDHAKSFHVCVEIAGVRYESCWGASKKQAEQQAALNALRALGVAVACGDGEVTIVGGAVSGASEQTAHIGAPDSVDAGAEAAGAPGSDEAPRSGA